MKKTISVFLILAMCLSLCACGVKAEYKALVEQLEEGDFAGAGEELLLLSPELAKEYHQLCEEAALYQKYDDLIDCLEGEDYEGAAADLQSRIPEPPKPTSTEVQITMDNWQEYFELREVPVADAFGRLECVTLLFVPREEYLYRLDYSSEFAVDISHVDTYLGEYHYSFDPQTGAFSYLDATYKSNDLLINTARVTNTSLKYYLDNGGNADPSSRPGEIYAWFVYGDAVQKYTVELDNIKGSIFVLDSN